MIDFAGDKKRVTKDSIAAKHSRPDPSLLRALSPIPKIFEYVNVSNNLPNSNREVTATVQMNCYGEGVVINSPSGNITIVDLPGKHVFYNGYSSTDARAIMNAPIQYRIQGKKHNQGGTNYEEIVVAGFYPSINYLIIGGTRDRTTNNGNKTIDRQNITFIREIFKAIRKGKYKKVSTTPTNKNQLMIGSDPEFSLKRGEERVPAHKYLGEQSSGKLGCDGHAETGELRPDPDIDPIMFVRRQIKPLLRELHRKIPSDVKVTTGGGFIDPLGDHIHFNKTLSAEEVQLLDDFVGGPSKNMPGGNRAGGSYGTLGEVREQPHGSEYRTCPSGFIPEFLVARYVTAWCIVKKWEGLRRGETFDYDIDIDGIPTKDSYVALAGGRKKYITHLKTFHHWVTKGEIKTEEDFLGMWFKRKRGKTPKYRAILKNPMEWAPHFKRIAIKGLTKDVEITVDSFTPSELELGDSEQETTPKSTIILSVPYEKAESIRESDELQDRLIELCDMIDTDIALRSSSGGVDLRFPSSWKKRKETITPQFVREVVRFVLKGE